MITTRTGPGLVRDHIDRTARRRAAARRARVLLSLAVVAITSWGIVALPGVPFWMAVPATTLLVLDVVALVVSARRRTSARRAAARRLARTAALAQVRLAAQRRPTAPAEVPLPAPRSDAVAEAASGASPATPVEPAASTGPSAGSSAGADDGTWTPVPVPRPTYMLKPVVRRAEPAPLESDPDVPPAATASVPERPTQPRQPQRPAQPVTPPRPWEVEHTWADDLDLFLARRRAANG